MLRVGINVCNVPKADPSDRSVLQNSPVSYTFKVYNKCWLGGGIWSARRFPG